jgi:hypothetical protein
MVDAFRFAGPALWQGVMLIWQAVDCCEREYALTDEGEKLKKKLTHKGTAA